MTTAPRLRPKSPQGAREPGQPPTLTRGVAMRIAILGGIALVLLSVLFIRLWFLQVIGSEQYAERAEGNRIRTVVVEPERGLITDRNGEVLVANQPSRDLVARPGELVGAQRTDVIKRLAPVLGERPAVLRERLEDGEDTPFQSVVIAEDVNQDVELYLAERRQSFPGLSLKDTFTRAYPQGATAAHILGYTGAITEENVEAYREGGYQGNERVGVAGIESQYEQFLRGSPGRVEVEVDAQGQPVGRGVVDSVPPRPGRNVELSIDLRTQEALEEAMREQLALSGLAEGAAGVALDPRTGEILAMASAPTFSPKAFSENDAKRLRQIQRNPLKPLVNRAITGQYPVGSTFKAITGTAALEAGVLDRGEFIGSPGQLTLYKQDFRNFRFAAHGDITLPTALEVSSDTFFFTLGSRFFERPDSKLQEWAYRFGFGEPTGIDIPGEAAGVVPTPDWKRENFAGDPYGEIDRIWKPGDTIQLTVGQGYFEGTPLQLATAYGAIANGGRVVKPTIGRRIMGASGRQERSIIAGGSDEPLGASAQTLERIHEGLVLAANGDLGTATPVFFQMPDGKRVAGKTGTAEVPPGEDHSWFVGYAPADDPEVVVAVVVERGGTGASAAAPVVCKTISANLGMPTNQCGSGALPN